MEEFNTSNIFTIPLVLRSNCVESTDNDSVNGLQVELTNGENVVQKTLLLYQDTSILDSSNGQSPPLVRFLCEVDNNEDPSADSSDNVPVQSSQTVEEPSETLNISGETCSLSFSNDDDINDDSSSVKFRDDVSTAIGIKSCEMDSLDNSLDDFIKTVVLYQCKLCQHASNDKNDVVRHLRLFHLIINAQKEAMVILEGDKESDDELRKIKVEEDKNDDTQTVYMCCQCSLPFETMAECRSHMSNHPKLKGNNKVNNAKTSKNDSLSKIVHLTFEPADPVTMNTPLCQMKVEPSEEVKEGEGCPDLIKEKNYKCSKEACHLKFSTEDYMKQHAECHVANSKTQYKCSKCHYTYGKWSELSLHLWKSHHIDLDLYKCSVCTFKSVSRSVLRRHFRNHAVGDFYCMECGKSFVASEKFEEHSATHKSPDVEAKKRECGECGVKLSSAKAVKKHVKIVHGKLRPYVCQVCPFTSSTMATLTLHQRQHTGETPFTCELCPYKTRDHNTMRRHRQRHSVVKPYSCKYCLFSTVQSTSLKHHILRFHPESKDVLQCPDCTFTTMSESLMTSHRKVHHRDGRPNKINDEVDRDRNLSSMFPSSKSKESNSPDLKMEVDEESSSQCYFENETHIDTGGITIPAEETENKSTVKCTSDSQLNDPGGGIQTTNGILVPNEDTMPLS